MVLLLPLFSAEAATYYADPAGSASASCVDIAANACTLARAVTVSSPGDTIVAASGTYDQGGTTLNVNKNVTIVPFSAGGAIITGTNLTSIVDLTPSNDANVLTFGEFDVRSTGSTSQLVRIVNVAYDATVQIVGTTVITGGTNRHIQDAYTRGTVKIIRPTLGGTIGAQAGIYSIVTPSAAKKLDVTGVRAVLTASASNTPAVYIERAAGSSVSEWVHVADSIIDVTVPPGLGASALGIGIRLHRITSGTNPVGSSEEPIVERNLVTLTTLGATSVDAFAIVVSSTDATAVADNAIIRDNVVTCNGPATRCVSVGTDGVTSFFTANAQIYRNRIVGPFYNGLATPHGLHIGRVSGGLAWGNLIYGFAVAALLSMNNGAVVTGNLMIGAQYAPLYSKGSGSTTAPVFANNTVIMDDSLYGAHFGAYGCMGVAVQGATNNAAATFTNNLCWVKNGTGWKYVVVDASQVASFDANNYYSDVALTNPWSYQGSATDLATWNALATVGTDLNTNPQFVSPTDYRLSGRSALRSAGTVFAGCKSFYGLPCPSPPDIGAYQRRSDSEYPSIRERRR